MTGIFVASALVVALVLLALMVHRRGRRAHATSPEAPGASVVTTPGDSPTYTVGPGPDDLVLVPFPNDTGQALVVGPEYALTIFDRSGLTKRDTSAGSGPVPQLVRDAMAAGGLNATDQFQQGANSGRIVALTPETMKRLEKGRPVYDKAGNVLASVRGEKGYLSPMHLDKAGAQVAAASNMATLAVTAALSQQLEAISEQLQEMSQTLEGMVKDKDRERLSDALAANEILFEIAESVRRRGITQADYMQLASLKHRVTSLQIEISANSLRSPRTVSPKWDATSGSKFWRASTRRSASSTGWQCRSKQTSRGLGAISSRCFGNTVPTLRLLRPSTRTSPTRSDRGSFARPKSAMRCAPCRTRPRRPGSIRCA